MADKQLYLRAADCYRQAQLPLDAIRCYHEAGVFRQAADLSLALGNYDAAAGDYLRAGEWELAAWLLVHHCSNPAEAREMIRQAPEGAPGQQDPRIRMHSRLVLCRCEIADGLPPSVMLSVIDDVCAVLADPACPYERRTEEWAIALASHARRYDQAALVFAAATRGHRDGARERWRDWADQVLGIELTIPGVPDPEPIIAEDVSYLRDPVTSSNEGEPTSAISLADAVQAAQEEALEFGSSIARDAPALWLEAVLHRKPRMPSDLEARLLQASALPIDFLLHDEVRRALRRGFWDALERARR